MLKWWLDQCHVVCHYSLLHLQSSLASSFNINNFRSSSSFSITDGFANLRKLAIILNIKDFATSEVLENCIRYFLACIDHIHQIIYEHQTTFVSMTLRKYRLQWQTNCGNVQPCIEKELKLMNILDTKSPLIE